MVNAKTYAVSSVNWWGAWRVNMDYYVSAYSVKFMYEKTRIFPLTVHMCMKYAHHFNSVKIMDLFLRKSAT